MTRRRQVIEMATAESNRWATAAATTQERIRLHIIWLEAELEELNKEIDDFIKQLPTFRQKQDILTSTPGIGAVTSAILLALW